MATFCNPDRRCQSDHSRADDGDQIIVSWHCYWPPYVPKLQMLPSGSVTLNPRLP